MKKVKNVKKVTLDSYSTWEEKHPNSYNMGYIAAEFEFIASKHHTTLIGIMCNDNCYECTYIGSKRALKNLVCGNEYNMPDAVDWFEDYTGNFVIYE